MPAAGTLIGIPLGILSAVWRNRWLDHLVRIMAITGISTPAFWLGLGVIVLFYGHLQILPGGGRLDDWLDPPTHVTGFYLLDALLEGNGEVFFNALQHLILPALTLAFVHLGIVARQIRSAMLEQLSEDYIRTARASGLPGWYIVLCYALPNALIHRLPYWVWRWAICCMAQCSPKPFLPGPEWVHG